MSGATPTPPANDQNKTAQVAAEFVADTHTNVREGLIQAKENFAKLFNNPYMREAAKLDDPARVEKLKQFEKDTEESLQDGSKTLDKQQAGWAKLPLVTEGQKPTQQSAVGTIKEYKEKANTEIKNQSDAFAKPAPELGEVLSAATLAKAKELAAADVKATEVAAREAENSMPKPMDGTYGTAKADLDKKKAAHAAAKAGQQQLTALLQQTVNVPKDGVDKAGKPTGKKEADAKTLEELGIAGYLAAVAEDARLRTQIANDTILQFATRAEKDMDTNSLNRSVTAEYLPPGSGITMDKSDTVSKIDIPNEQTRNGNTWTLSTNHQGQRQIECSPSNGLMEFGADMRMLFGIPRLMNESFEIGQRFAAAAHCSDPPWRSLNMTRCDEVQTRAMIYFANEQRNNNRREGQPRIEVTWEGQPLSKSEIASYGKYKPMFDKMQEKLIGKQDQKTQDSDMANRLKTGLEQAKANESKQAARKGGAAPKPSAPTAPDPDDPDLRAPNRRAFKPT